MFEKLESTKKGEAISEDKPIGHYLGDPVELRDYICSDMEQQVK